MNALRRAAAPAWNATRVAAAQGVHGDEGHTWRLVRARVGRDCRSHLVGLGRKIRSMVHLSKRMMEALPPDGGLPAAKLPWYERDACMRIDGDTATDCVIDVVPQ